MVERMILANMSPWKYSKKRSSKSSMNRLREELLKWICKRHAINGPLDRNILRDKALDLSAHLETNDFKCSESWLMSFLKKHGFSSTLTDCRGPTFTDYRVWVDLMKPLFIQYRYKDLFHVDEMTMYSDILPEKISSWSHRHDLTKTNRVTVLVCCNATGTEKLPLVISGSYQGDIGPPNCRYRYDENSRISEELFNEWLTQFNEQMASQGRRVLLLLHRSRLHTLKNVNPSHVTLVFFPEAFPPKLRPLRRDVFQYMKMIYRRKYVSKTTPECVLWDPETVIQNLVASWEEIPRDLVVFSFQRTNFRSDDCFLDFDCTGWDNQEAGITFRRFVTFDDDLLDTPTMGDAGGRHRYNLRKTYSRGGQVPVDLEEENAENQVKPLEDDEFFRKWLNSLEPETRSKRRRREDPATESVRNTTRSGKDVDFIQDFRSELWDRCDDEEKIEEMVDNAVRAVDEGMKTFATLPSTSGASELGEKRVKKTVSKVHCCYRRRTSHNADSSPRIESCENVPNTSARSFKNSTTSPIISPKTTGRSSDSLRKSNALLSNTPEDVSRAKKRRRTNNMSSDKESPGRASEYVENVPEKLHSLANESSMVSNNDPEDPNEIASLTEEGKDFNDERKDPYDSEDLDEDPGEGGINPIVSKDLQKNPVKLFLANRETRPTTRSEGPEGTAQSTSAMALPLENDGSDDDDPLVLSAKRKRSKDSSNEDNTEEPAEKRAKTGDNWHLQYQTNFAFGSGSSNPPNQRSANVDDEVDDDCVIECCKLIEKTQYTQTRSNEVEKRCIFTMSGNSPSPPRSAKK